jgi:hypothetical protein
MSSNGSRSLIWNSTIVIRAYLIFSKGLICILKIQNVSEEQVESWGIIYYYFC